MLGQDVFFLFVGSLILSFTCNLFAYFKFYSDWRRLIGKLKQNELDCRDTALQVGTFLGIQNNLKIRDTYIINMMLSGNFYGSQIRHWIFWGLNFGTEIFFLFCLKP